MQGRRWLFGKLKNSLWLAPLHGALLVLTSLRLLIWTVQRSLDSRPRATGWKGGANPHDVLKSILASSLKYSFAHAPPLPLGYGKFSLVESPAWPAKKHALLTHTEDKAQNPLGRWVTVRETRDSRIPLPKKNEAFNSSGVTYTKTWLPAY